MAQPPSVAPTGMRDGSIGLRGMIRLWWRALPARSGDAGGAWWTVRWMDRRRGTRMDDDRRNERYERTHDPSRVLAFSDGVCAIIITLLVIEIHVPALGNGESL